MGDDVITLLWYLRFRLNLPHLKLSSFSRSAVAIDFLLGCSLWYASCSKLRGIVTQKPDRATLIKSFGLKLIYKKLTRGGLIFP